MGTSAKFSSTENVTRNPNPYTNAFLVDTDPQAIEPFDKEWASPFRATLLNPLPSRGSTDS